MYYKDVSGVLLCFDLTDEESFKNINFWLSDLNKHAPAKMVKVLVGNKADLCNPTESMGSSNNKREISKDLAHAFALENQLHFYEVSAKTG
jgi:GTPase SAR1 family protein